MTWDTILKMAKDLYETNGKDKNLALILAANILDFDAAMLTGKRGLPSRWEKAAVHLAGYSK